MATELLERPDLLTPSEPAPTRTVSLRGFWEGRVLGGLSNLRHGQIQLNCPSGFSLHVGTAAEDDLRTCVTIHEDRCLREIALGGSLGAAETYLQGLWSTSDLVALLRIFCRNMDELTRMDTGFAAATAFAARVLHRFARNSTRGSRRNIAAHYDLSNEFFQLFLDPTLMYSSGLFEQPEQSMEQASVTKLDRICRKLDLQPGDHVMEVGTGWGGWALHAARHYGCRITTTTISRNQFDLARQRIAAAGLNDRIEVLLEDDRSGRARIPAAVFPKVRPVIEAWRAHAGAGDYHARSTLRRVPQVRRLHSAIHFSRRTSASHRRDAGSNGAGDSAAID